MKKKLLSLLCLALAAVLLFAGCQSAVEEPEPTPESATYTATAAGFGGDVTVTLVADGSGVITAVTVEGANETPGFGADAIERFNKELAALVAATPLRRSCRSTPFRAPLPPATPCCRRSPPFLRRSAGRACRRN